MNEIVIQAEGLTRYFGRKKAVDSLSLSIRRGSVYGFLGRNGSGKTTTIRMLLGMLHSTRGRSALLGCDSENLTPEIKARVGYLSEGHPLFTGCGSASTPEFLRNYYPNWDRPWFDAALARFRLDPKRRIGTLSRGERAQVALALCLAPQPELLILDDPAMGLDPVVRRDFLESIVEMIQQEGRTIFFSSHNLADVERVADRIGIIEEGVLRADCGLDTFKEERPARAVPVPRRAAPGDQRAGAAARALAGERGDAHAGLLRRKPPGPTARAGRGRGRTGRRGARGPVH